MVLLWSEIAVTVLSVHVISGQSQGKDEEFHDWSDGGLPSCCLTSSRIDRSSSKFWEITWNMERTRRKNRVGNGAVANNKGSFDILWRWVRYRLLYEEGGRWPGNGIVANKKGSFDILWRWVCHRLLCEEVGRWPGKSWEEECWECGGNQRFNFKIWGADRIYSTEFYKLTCLLELITKEPRVHDQWTWCFVLLLLTRICNKPCTPLKQAGLFINILDYDIYLIYFNNECILIKFIFFMDAFNIIIKYDQLYHSYINLFNKTT